MPKRTNSFQKIVTIVHSQLAGDAIVEESVELTDRVTGDKREVDAVIRSQVAGYEMVLGIEATITKGTITWVEQTIAKHQHLPTNRLVLVAERGASVKAFRKAEREGVPLIVPEVLTEDDPSYTIVNKLETIWPKGFNLTAEQMEVVVDQRGKSVSFVAPPDTEIYLSDGRLLGLPGTVFRRVAERGMPQFMEQLGIAGITEDRDENFILRITPPDSSEVDPTLADSPMDLCLKWLEVDELHKIDQLAFSGPISIRVAEMKLTHRRFRDAAVAYGQAQIGDQSALLVVTEDESGATSTLDLSDSSGGGSDADKAEATRSYASNGEYSHGQRTETRTWVIDPEDGSLHDHSSAIDS